MPLRLPKQFHPDFSRPGVKPTGAVEVDWSNPLARGLKLAYLPELGVELVIKQLPSAVTAPLSVHGGEKQLISDAVNNYYADLLPTVTFDAGLTIVFSAYIDSIAGYVFDNTGGGARTAFADTGSSWFLYLGNQTRSYVSYDFLPAGEHRICVISYKRTDPTNTIYYSNGKKYDRFGSGATATAVYSFSPHLMQRYNGPNKLNGGVGSFFVLDRAVSEAEAQQLSIDPYQILKPAQPMMLFLPAGGTTGYTLNADVNANTLGGDGVSLLANRSLAADVNSFTLGADGVTLSSGITLVADVNTLTVGGDDVALTANRLIGADVNALTLGGDGVDLTAGWTFSADVNTLTLGGDDVTLTYTSGATYTLTADAGAYTVSSDGVDLLANRLLTADARVYILSADSVTLSVGVVDTDDCYVWLQSQITDVAYTVSAINVNNYLVSDVDDTAQYLTSAFGAESIYLESCICHCA